VSIIYGQFNKTAGSGQKKFSLLLIMAMNIHLKGGGIPALFAYIKAGGQGCWSFHSANFGDQKKPQRAQSKSIAGHRSFACSAYLRSATTLIWDGVIRIS
jgi:hypothetical protein